VASVLRLSRRIPTRHSPHPARVYDYVLGGNEQHHGPRDVPAALPQI